MVVILALLDSLFAKIPIFQTSLKISLARETLLAEALELNTYLVLF